MENNTCREMWCWNRNEEMVLIEECLRNYRCIAIDTEFPGSLRPTSQKATDEESYDDMRYSVDRTKVIQLGLTLFDTDGEIGGSWEINFSDFGDLEDARNEKSIAFLKRNGLDLEMIRKYGIRIDDFFSDLGSMLELAARENDITWVTFHGSYDIAYLLKYLTGESLPVTSERFSKAVARTLGSVYDLKAMAGRYEGLSDRLGLESLAHEFQLNRVGTAHHAGSDSELTARVFIEMGRMCDNVVDESEGFVYGLGYRVISDRLKQRQSAQLHIQNVMMMMEQRYEPPPLHIDGVMMMMMMERCYEPPPLPLPLPLLGPRFVAGFPPFGGFV